MTVELDILLLGEELRELLELAEENGNLLQSQLNDVLEPLGLEPLETDSIYRELEKRAIEVIEDLRDDGEPELQPLPAPRPQSAGLEVTTDGLASAMRPGGIRC